VIGYIQKCREIRDKPIILIARVLRNLASALGLAGSEKGPIATLKNEEPLDSL